MQLIAEQVVAVAGASSGIGRATALRSAEQGAAVVVAARGEPGLKSVGHRDNPPRMTLPAWPISGRGRKW